MTNQEPENRTEEKALFEKALFYYPTRSGDGAGFAIKYATELVDAWRDRFAPKPKE